MLWSGVLSSGVSSSGVFSPGVLASGVFSSGVFSCRMCTSGMCPGAATAHAGAARAQGAEQLEERSPLGRAEAAEHLLGTVASGGLEAIEEPPPVVGESHEDRPSIAGIGATGDEPRHFEGIDHGRDRTGDHFELRGEVGHPQWATGRGHVPQHPGLGIGETERGELHDRSPAQSPGGVGQELGELERPVRAGPGLVGACPLGHGAPLG